MSYFNSHVPGKKERKTGVGKCGCVCVWKSVMISEGAGVLWRQGRR